MQHELAAIDVTHMRGLEIGPLASPRVRKDQGAVWYLDHASAAELKQKYSPDPTMQGRLDEIVELDYVITEKSTIWEVVAEDAPFDYVIAAHVIEHIPDPIGWMADLTHVLRPGGILSLVIPDKRYCFDINRSLTEISDLVDANLRQLRQPSYRQAFDFHSKAICGTVDTAAVWAGTADYSLAVRQDYDDPEAAALNLCRMMETSDEFLDLHCHVFTPESFLSLIEKLARLDLIDYEVADFFPTELNAFEFFVSLRLLDASAGGDSLSSKQLASLARFRDGEGHPATTTGAKPPGVNKGVTRLENMEVSPLEKRVLDFKRNNLERIRAMLRRGR
jgi:hypothetical protein